MSNSRGPDHPGVQNNFFDPFLEAWAVDPQEPVDLIYLCRRRLDGHVVRGDGVGCLRGCLHGCLHGRVRHIQSVVTAGESGGGDAQVVAFSSTEMK